VSRDAHNYNRDRPRALATLQHRFAGRPTAGVELEVKNCTWADIPKMFCG
jgi:hypothetical protein